MKAGQTLLDENGVEVSLYPDTVVQYAPHTEYIAYDLGGKQMNYLYAPTKAKVAKCDQANQWHEAYFYCYGLTPKGVAKFTMLAMHDNDVSDLIAGKEFAQGDLLYTEGGFGPNGPKSYASHIHLQVCFGWTTQKVKNALGKWTLKGACPINEVFFVNGTEVITKGLDWVEYAPPIVETDAQTETPTETPVETPTPEPMPEPTPNESLPVPVEAPTVEPIQEPTTKEEHTPSANTPKPQTTPKSPVNGLYVIIAWFIGLIVALFTGNKK